VYVFILLSPPTVSVKIKGKWKNSKNVSSKCSCSLNDRLPATVPLLFWTTIDALLRGGRQQLEAAGTSDNNARPFGQTVKYTVSCISKIQKCSYTDKNTDTNKVQIQNVNTYKANQYL
jgi:hypothetical protein